MLTGGNIFHTGIQKKKHIESHAGTVEMILLSARLWSWRVLNNFMQCICVILHSAVSKQTEKRKAVLWPTCSVKQAFLPSGLTLPVHVFFLIKMIDPQCTWDMTNRDPWDSSSSIRSMEPTGNNTTHTHFMQMMLICNGSSWNPQMSSWIRTWLSVVIWYLASDFKMLFIPYNIHLIIAHGVWSYIRVIRFDHSKKYYLLL